MDTDFAVQYKSKNFVDNCRKMWWSSCVLQKNEIRYQIYYHNIVLPFIIFCHGITIFVGFDWIWALADGAIKSLKQKALKIHLQCNIFCFELIVQALFTPQSLPPLSQTHNYGLALISILKHLNWKSYWWLITISSTFYGPFFFFGVIVCVIHFRLKRMMLLCLNTNFILMVLIESRSLCEINSLI